jgi:hypothetical protein
VADRPCTTGGLNTIDHFWRYAFASAALLILCSEMYSRRRGHARSRAHALLEGPMFGTLLDMLQRPYILPVILFILVFKLGDSAMGFMIKPFWVDSGFSATQIGLVSVNIGLGLSIAGGIAGGWFTDRVGIFKGLWVLGLLQAASNLGYAWAASIIPAIAPGTPIAANHQALMVPRQRHRILHRRTGHRGLSRLPDVHRQQEALGHGVCAAIFRVRAESFRLRLGRGVWRRDLRLCRLLSADLLARLPGLPAAAVGQKNDGVRGTAGALGTTVSKTHPAITPQQPITRGIRAKGTQPVMATTARSRQRIIVIHDQRRMVGEAFRLVDARAPHQSG